MKLTCMSCGYEFEDIVSKDYLGWHGVCPQCESSFDVDIDEYPDTTEIDGILFNNNDVIYQYGLDLLDIEKNIEHREIEIAITKALKEIGILVIGCAPNDGAWTVKEYGL